MKNKFFIFRSDIFNCNFRKLYLAKGLLYKVKDNTTS